MHYVAQGIVTISPVAAHIFCSWNLLGETCVATDMPYATLNSAVSIFVLARIAILLHIIVS